MSKKEIYKQENEVFLKKISEDTEAHKLPDGVLYKIINRGCEDKKPLLNSIVTVHYKGCLINGREFDNSWKRNCPEAFRLNEVRVGWQLALQNMVIGDRWIIYIPYNVGYGTRSNGPIPAFSTLIFEVELLAIS